MTDLAMTGIFSILTAVSTGTFSIIVRQGRHHGNAYTGVLIGLVVSIPILILYEVSIIIAKVVIRNQNKSQENI